MNIEERIKVNVSKEKKRLELMNPQHVLSGDSVRVSVSISTELEIFQLVV